ncbi:ADP-ribosylglycohydrolase family protein [Robiginitalea sp. SC105]|uniref:ADP-ribosylglycohydrolase family protein n=1 Tax=Robiginitalea sp. SC105 TaxID=2762332 RepID=UPI001639A40D|nr:ADP-ribosylglycohydrolase family protein [Robiginitalea sp. SC105]MBC2837817.1 ADP-ribosylglycohydrolase family protein [Robiginitalea sp. SC105]
MKIKYYFLLAACFLGFPGCKTEPAHETEIPAPVKLAYGDAMRPLDGDAYYNKVLGALAGSAIGDAMGASTEMWGRSEIRRTYGYLLGITPAIRPQSPEGTWDHNLQAGATTDDTRWKAVMADYIGANRGELGPKAFARTLTGYYESVVSELDNEALLESTDAIDSTLERVDWIREWARVAKAYQAGPESYNLARDRFYGGDLTCAGMLYTPTLGLVAEDPEAAYRLAYDHALFDLGYARDISALVAAMTQMALQTRQTDSLLNTAVFIDPYRFEDSRLVGRISLTIALSARNYVKRARLMRPLPPGALRDSLVRSVPPGYPDGPDAWRQQESIYANLENDQKAHAFHAGEIWQILVAGIEFGQGDFLKSMQFIVNYGRDNDTVAAVAGMILGAQTGFDGLPEAERNLVLRVSREQLGIDLEAMAREICGIQP